MKKETDDALAADEVKDSLPSLEDILTPASWEDRIAKARERREKVLSGEGNPVAPEASKNPKKNTTSAPDAVDETAPGIKEILATANWSDRLAKAKAHRDQVIAKRENSGQAPAAHIPGKMPALYKDTVRVAVSGAASVGEGVESTETKTNAAVVFPEIAPAANTQKKRFKAGYIAAGIALALGIGLIAPSPFRKTVTVEEQTPLPTSDPAPQVETETSQAPLPEATQTNQTVALDLIVPALPQPFISESMDLLAAPLLASDVVTKTPDTEDGFVPGADVVSALQQPANVAVPIILTRPYEAIPPVSAENQSGAVLTATAPAPKPVLEVAPEYLDDIATFQIGPDSPTATNTTQFQPTAFEIVRINSAPDIISPSGFRRDAGNFGVSELTGSIGTNGANAFVSLSAASMDESFSTFRNSNISRPDVSAVTLQTDADHSIQPTNIVFLSGPALSELPVSVPAPLRQLAVVSGVSDISFGNFGEISQELDFIAPPLVGKPVRLASISSIPLSALQQDPAIAPDAPESFEALSVRFASLSPDIVEEAPGFPGVDAYTIHLHAPGSLADDKLEAFATALRDTGFTVKDPKRVKFTIRNNNVRYFHASDAEAAGVLAAAVDAKARDFTDYSPPPPVGTIEVWLAGETPPASSRRPARRPSGQNAALNELRNRLLLSLRRGDHL